MAPASDLLHDGHPRGGPQAIGPCRQHGQRLLQGPASTVAPPARKPVEVLRKSAPASTACRAASVLRSSSSRPHSRMTLRRPPAPWTLSATAASSSRTLLHRPSMIQPRLITRSISLAPSSRAPSVSASLTAVVAAPRGNPQTEATSTPLPRSCSTAIPTRTGLTQTAANPHSRASPQRRTISASRAWAFSSVWSMVRASLCNSGFSMALFLPVACRQPWYRATRDIRTSSGTMAARTGGSGGRHPVQKATGRDHADHRDPAPFRSGHRPQR